MLKTHVQSLPGCTVGCHEPLAPCQTSAHLKGYFYNSSVRLHFLILLVVITFGDSGAEHFHFVGISKSAGFLNNISYLHFGKKRGNWDHLFARRMQPRKTSPLNP